MINDQNGAGFAIATTLVLVIAYTGVRIFRKTRADKHVPPNRQPSQIAHIVEQKVSQDSGAGGAGLLLIIFSAISLYKYFTAETFNQQIVALLLWIGNGIFWGVFFVGMLISHARTSTIYRDLPPAEPQEPRF